MQLTHKILGIIDRYGMVKKGDRVLVCVSGGPDSVFLLYVLNDLKDALGITLYVAHLDHGIRGARSRRDARFVKKLADRMGLKAAFKKLKPEKLQSKLSPEEALRAKRYDFFTKTARKFNANVAATGHTLDDQAETVMMRLIKGASLKGVVGIHPVRNGKKPKFIRPLFEVEKKDILTFLKNKKITFCFDHTNLDERFLRNRIRGRVLPYLAKINPRIKRALFNLAESLREDFDFIKNEKAGREKIVRGGKGFCYIKLCEIFLQPRALRREIVREAFRISGGNIKKLTYRHWKDINDLIVVKQKGKSLDLPGGVRMKKMRDRLLFIR